MRSAVFVMPRDPAHWGGAAALWVTVAGWAEAAERAGFDPLIVTPHGLLTIEDCLEATRLGPSVGNAPRRHKVSTYARQGVSDVQRAIQMAKYRGSVRQHFEDVGDVAFVWQHHDLFHTAGERLARRASAPLIEYVHAPVVWEAARWGVHRPGWGRALERLGDSPQLRRASLVACVTDEVARRVVELGALAERVMVSPMGVDPIRFAPTTGDSSIPGHSSWRFGDLVVGWVGSFRKFHALELAFDATSTLGASGTRIDLVLAGDGPDRPRLQQLANSLGIADRVHFVGQIGNVEMPAFLRSVDAAVITAKAGQEFHYSPLKLREYQAIGIPVVAPRIGEMARSLAHRSTALLYEPGDLAGLAECLKSLATDPHRCARIGAAGRDLVLTSGTWDALLQRALDHLGGAR